MQCVAFGEEVGRLQFVLDFGNIMRDVEGRVALVAANARHEIGEGLFKYHDDDEGFYLLRFIHCGKREDEANLLFSMVPAKTGMEEERGVSG